MLDEIHKLCNKLEEELKSTDINEEGERLMELALKFNISIVNALWVLLVGEKLELNDDRLMMIVKVLPHHSDVNGCLTFPSLLHHHHKQ